MKKVNLFHNPKAGAEQYDKKELVSLIESQGFKCVYTNVKKDSWEITPDVDFIAIAGGDGTIRKVISGLLERSLIEKKYPIGILPLGTANNLSKSINKNNNIAEIIESWHKGKTFLFDVGRITGLKEEFFIEGIGFGAFAEFMHEMIEEHIKPDNSGEKVKYALQMFKKHIKSAEESSYEIILDGVTISDKFILVEIMNIKSIGPNLYLNPTANFSDGKFDVVLISKEQQHKFYLFLEALSKGKKARFPFPVKKAKSIEVRSGKTCVHVDDQIVHVKELDIRIEAQRSIIEFLV